MGLIVMLDKPVRVNVAEAVLEDAEESTAVTALTIGNVCSAFALKGTINVVVKVPLDVGTLDFTVEPSNFISTVTPSVLEKP
jgi:hypothetical protein